ncbi:methyltransferase domain-containing protein [Salinicola sp. JS01]|uniref:class I SAM-dependent methyltransferase n=1 Tax=Salinicola sp. JS01 TaxID=3050071 RepID=UPI00255BCB4C|nr:class I SAM-dependent methyltransferase [Salinicola sp. JS01]WIX32088.1 methyltransferase domain-containing protein [Salinicola sp. JS01]
MKQNIYDNPDFFSGYMALREREGGLNAAIEEPAVRRLLPTLNGLDVLDLGCGFGKFSEYCLAQDLRRYVGVDISEKMIAEARRRYPDKRAQFHVSALEDAEFDVGSYDAAVASMCLHYVEDLGGVLDKVASALRPTGRLVLSVEHPICTALLAGWHDSEQMPRMHWPVDDYFTEGRRSTTWFVDGMIKYHRTLDTYLSAALAAGLSIARVLEPQPTAEAIEAQPRLAEHLRRPPILVMGFDKRPHESQSSQDR